MQFWFFSGIGLIVQQYSIVLIVLKWLGVFYLLYLAYKAFISRASTIEVSPQETPQLKMYLSAMFVSLTNPKALLASLMLYPLFISHQLPFLSQAILLTLTAMAISFGIYTAYSLAASTVKNKLSSSSFSNKLAGSLYLGAAGALATKHT